MNQDELDIVELPEWKDKAHKAFDILWQRGHMGRNGAYRFLAARMGLSTEKCHIGLFDVAQCKKVIAICEPFEAFAAAAPAS